MTEIHITNFYSLNYYLSIKSLKNSQIITKTKIWQIVALLDNADICTREVFQLILTKILDKLVNIVLHFSGIFRYLYR